MQVYAQYRLTWGSGEVIIGQETLPTLDAVRGMLAEDTDMLPEEIDRLIALGRVSEADTDPTTGTQFDCNWIRLERSL